MTAFPYKIKKCLDGFFLRLETVVDVLRVKMSSILDYPE